jgi:transcriptional regulator with XRE-family HTH domain
MSHRLGRLDGPTHEALIELGRVLRQLRGERGLSQRALAARCGLSQATISLLENGKAEGVRVAWVARLLAGLDARVDILPDERHLLDRSRGFRALRAAFDLRTGGARTRARELERRRSVAEILRRHEIEQADRQLEERLARADGERWTPGLGDPGWADGDAEVRKDLEVGEDSW